MDDKILLSRHDLLAIIDMASDRSAAKMAELAGLGKKDMISQNKAFQEFGETFVRRMITGPNPQVIGQRRGVNRTSRIVYSHSQLKILKQAESISTLR